MKLKNRILFTIFALFVYRLGCALTIPTLNSVDLGSNGLLATLNMLGGGALNQMSLFSLGVGPYITAGIIVQLLSDVIPILEEWKDEGHRGKTKIENTTKNLTVILAFVQALGLSYAFDKQYGIMQNASLAKYLYVATVMTAGSSILLWLSSQISKKGIGNGTSMIILAGIVSSLPSTLLNTYSILVAGLSGANLVNGLIKFGLYILAFLVIMLLVVIVESAVRKIPLKSTRGTAASGSDMSVLPIKLNVSGVIPVIFAQSVLTAPQIILSFINYNAYTKVSDFLSLSKPTGIAIYAVLIILFSFFYTHTQMDAKEIEKNLRSSNTYIPGVRLGNDTVTYLRKVLNRLTSVGSILLMLLAVTPLLLAMFTNLSTVSAIGGTGIILIVGITTDIAEQLKTYAKTQKYAKFKGGFYGG